jgi:hypothetical protein
MKKGLFALALLTAVFAASIAVAQTPGEEPPAAQQTQSPAAQEQKPAAAPADTDAEKRIKQTDKDEASIATSQALSQGTVIPSKKKVDWGLLFLLEYGTNVNTSRPDQYASILLSPQLKFMYDHALLVRLSASYEFLNRIENYGWNLDDMIVEYAYNKKVWEKKEKELVLNLGASLRYYIPTSLNSRLADSYGQLRFIGRSSFQVWKFVFGFDFNAQKYFSKYYTWDTSETPGTPSWISTSGKEDYVETNTNFGLGEKLYVGVTPVDGLDITLSYAWIQSQRYDLSANDDPYDQKYSDTMPLPDKTTWSFSTQFVADVTYSFAAIPPIAKDPKLAASPLGHLAVSVGYTALVPELQNGGRKVSYNPFDPLYGYFYFDLAVVY